MSNIRTLERDKNEVLQKSLGLLNEGQYKLPSTTKMLNSFHKFSAEFRSVLFTVKVAY